MRKKAALSLLLSLILMVSAIPVFAIEGNVSNPASYNAIAFYEIDDSSLRQDVIDAATRNNIDLDVAEITIYENGVIVFFEPLETIPFYDGYVEEYGLYEHSPLTRGMSRPSFAASPNSHIWEFSGSANSGNPLSTARYVTGRSHYDLIVNNTGNRSITVRTRRKVFLGSLVIHTTEVPGNGSATITNIAANGTSCRVYVTFAFGPFTVDGSITGHNG